MDTIMRHIISAVRTILNVLVVVFILNPSFQISVFIIYYIKGKVYVNK